MFVILWRYFSRVEPRPKVARNPFFIACFFTRAVRAFTGHILLYGPRGEDNWGYYALASAIVFEVKEM